MDTIDLKGIRERLKNGSFTDEDIAQGQEIIKSLRAGNATPESLGLVSPPPAHPAPPAAPAASVVETPNVEAMKKALEAHPESQRAINAVPAIQALAENQRQLAESQAALAKSLSDLTASVGELVTLTKSLPAAREASQESRGDERVQFGDDLRKALDLAIQSSGLGEKIAELDQAVNHRPYSGNPPRSAAPVRKSMAADRFTKSMATTVIQKGLAANQMTEDEACRALEVLDMAQHVGKSYEEICRQVAPQMLKDFLGE